MKRINIVLMAFALVLTMTQCKKNEETNQDVTVTITLDVKGNNGSKVDVNTITGTVNFETGDKVYVGSGGKYVGTLTHNGTKFIGNITNPTEGQPLQFYFLGNVTPNETLAAGTTEECSVVISDQTEHLPVISCASSYENYVSGVTSYTGHLLNKCALVKFNVTTLSNSTICIIGMKNKVTVDFSENTIIPSQDGEGVIMLPNGAGENVEKWAILLPQEELEEGEESVISFDGKFIGTRPIIPQITENAYWSDGINISLNMPGAINGLFSISDNSQVLFSSGNLQYQGSTSTWRFAENQWDYVGNATDGNVYEGGIKCDNSLIAQDYSGWIDLFGWGTGLNPTYISTTNNDYSYFREWGNNPIINGGNISYRWRTLTISEWEYIFNTRNTLSDIRYAKANVNGVNGVILLPDDWNRFFYNLNNTNCNDGSFDDNILTALQWITLEQHGAIFIPAAGIRIGTSVSHIESDGEYWSSTYDNTGRAFFIDFNGIQLYTNQGNYSRGYGRSVRLVQDYQP